MSLKVKRKLRRYTIKEKGNNREVKKGMVFCYQNCSDLILEKIVLFIEKKLLTFKAKGQEFEFF